MRRSPRIFSSFFVLMIIAAVTVAADCKPAIGHFEAQIVPPGEGHCPPVPGVFCTAGRVWGGIQGNYQFVITSFVPSGAVPSIFFFTGKSTIFLKNGDEVIGTDTGSIDLGSGGFASLITFDPASGASGQIRLRGESVEGTTSGDYLGTFCTD